MILYKARLHQLLGSSWPISVEVVEAEIFDSEKVSTNQAVACSCGGRCSTSVFDCLGR
jgi:hypothetical protein